MSSFSSDDYPEHLLLKNQVQSKENIALFNSAKAGSLNSVKINLEKGGKPNFFFNPEDSKNSLHVAAEGGFHEIVQELLNHGAVADCLVAGSKETALLLACREDHGKAAGVLINAGADLNAANCYGNTSLHETLREDYVELANVLVQAGCDVDAVNHKGSSPMHFLCYVEDPSDASASVAMLQLLLEKGADVQRRDQAGMTPFLVCCTTAREDLMKVLLAHGAQPSDIDATGRDAVSIATFYQHTKLAAALAKK